MSRIKTVIFDLGGVIVPFDWSHAYQRMEELSGLGRDEIRERILATRLVQDLECGSVESADFVARINAVLGINTTLDEFREIWVSIFDRQTLIPGDVLREIASCHRLLLLSNTNELHFDWIDDNYAELRPFHHRVLSYKVGAMKPSPRIYQAALENAHCEPQECFFTDDIADYVAGAKAAGIDAVQFRGFASLLAELSARGIVL